MGNVQDSRTCPHCAETIKAAARICPFCQQRFGWFAVWGYELALGGFGLCALIALGILGAKLEFDDSEQGRTAAQLHLAKAHRSELPVLEARAECDRGTNLLWILGVVTNQGSGSWRVQALEARLHDHAGRFLDARPVQPEPAFVVPPHGAHAFRTRFGPSARTNDLRVEVRVQRLTDGRLASSND